MYMRYYLFLTNTRFVSPRPHYHITGPAIPQPHQHQVGFHRYHVTHHWLHYPSTREEELERKQLIGHVIPFVFAAGAVFQGQNVFNTLTF